ncbi:hypothetical protein ACWGTI_32100 [Mesorhizobium sp. ArgA1]
MEKETALNELSALSEDLELSPIRGGLAAAWMARRSRSTRLFHRKGDRLAQASLAAFVTSPETMDKADGTARERIAKSADLIAAFRLPEAGSTHSTFAPFAAAQHANSGRFVAIHVGGCGR